jgi:aminoglycoside/choline kinase family phosphotransferase
MPLAPDALRQLVLPAAEEIAGGGPAHLVTLPGGASLRRYHRITIPGGAPSTLVVMELAEDRLGSEEAAKKANVTELPFIDVLRYLERGGIGVPHLHRYDEPAGLLYLEDLGDETFESRVAGASEETVRAYYRQAIDELVRLQRYAALHPSGCIAFQRGFDRELLRWELDHFREWGLEAGAGAQLTDAERAELGAIFDDIATRLAAEPRLFVHRDYQSRNLMVQDGASGAGGRRLRVIDFQDALLGTRAYDLVALLRDSYVELPAPLLGELVGYYATRAEVDPAAFRALFDLQTVQRKLKDAGRFVFIERVKKNPSFLPYIPSSQRYALAAMRRLPEMERLREIIARHVPAFML